MIPAFASDGFYSLHAIAVPAPFHAYLLPVQQYPIPQNEVAPLLMFWQEFATLLRAEQKLASCVFLQLFQYEGGAQRFAEYGVSWAPVLGLGVRPAGPAPARWTREDFNKLTPGEKPRPLAEQVLQITGDMHAARSQMLDIGSVLELLTSDSAYVLIEKCRRTLLPTIKERSFRSYSLYIPLLEAKTIASATDQELSDWLCGASVYIRESLEDKGILILSRIPIERTLSVMGGRSNSSSEWSIPYRQP